MVRSTPELWRPAMRGVHGIAFQGMQEKYEAFTQKGKKLAKGGGKSGEAKLSREEKLVQAMRANLKKRKQQQRERSVAKPASDEKPDDSSQSDG